MQAKKKVWFTFSGSHCRTINCRIWSVSRENHAGNITRIQSTSTWYKRVHIHTPPSIKSTALDISIWMSVFSVLLYYLEWYYFVDADANIWGMANPRSSTCVWMAWVFWSILSYTYVCSPANGKYCILQCSAWSLNRFSLTERIPIIRNQAQKQCLQQQTNLHTVSMKLIIIIFEWRTQNNAIQHNTMKCFIIIFEVFT